MGVEVVVSVAVGGLYSKGITVGECCRGVAGEK